ncbi:MAG TPA: hypothetical protein DCG19_12625 [Cryomorphaceae bacterium]|nr:hypothetical protein [Owenweeksia sp.]HAD98246.1 hypothetical protein [Cryomorphaceae bacterium]HBF21466.1 hypothetical protein [Cryomorphaceae bacterium]|tara:strand:+ start:15034 stop:15543 length:510 start_codon:yes stop_codon:yes gene_type:complete
MKKKNQIAILAPLVLLIWGIIGYRIYKAVKGNSEVSITTVSHLPVTMARVETTAYELQLDYDDPFLKNRKRYVPPSSQQAQASKPVSKVKPKVVKTVTKIPLQWPRIVYHGLISHKQDKTTIYLVEVDGASHLVQQGEMFQELELLKAFPDSVWLRYKKEEKKTFVKTP